MAGKCCNVSISISSKLVLLVLFVMVRISYVSIEAMGKHDWIAECHTEEDLSSWRLWRDYVQPEGQRLEGHEVNIQCDVQCPLYCTCSLGNITEIIASYVQMESYQLLAYLIHLM